MELSSILTIIGLSLSFIGLSANFYYSNKKTRQKVEEQIECKAKSQQEILTKLDTVATKDYLDKRLNQEVAEIKKGFKTEMDELKIDMKEQINALKLDIKEQQVNIGEVSKGVIEAKKSSEYAHDRINTVNDRIDDLKEMFILAQNKKS